MVHISLILIFRGHVVDQSHQNILGQLVDLIGITSIMEVSCHFLYSESLLMPRFLAFFSFVFLGRCLLQKSYILQVLIRLIGADEHMYSSYGDAMQWIESTDVLEMIVDKFSSSVSCNTCLSDDDSSFSFTKWVWVFLKL